MIAAQYGHLPNALKPDIHDRRDPRCRKSCDIIAAGSLTGRRGRSSPPGEVVAPGPWLNTRGPRCCAPMLEADTGGRYPGMGAGRLDRHQMSTTFGNSPAKCSMKARTEGSKPFRYGISAVSVESPAVQPGSTRRSEPDCTSSRQT